MFRFITPLLLAAASNTVTDPIDYQENSDLQYKWAMESLAVFPLEADDKVLDLGCGTGSMTVEIAAKVPRGFVIGLDISETMLNFAREHYQASNIIYMEGDARGLPFAEQFDKIIAFLSLNWVSEQEKALHSLHKALKTHGKAIITHPGEQPSNLGPVVSRLVKTDRWASYFPNYKHEKPYYTANEYKLLLEQAGLTVEKISEDSTYTYFKNRDALIGFFRPLCNFIYHLPPALQEQFVDDVVDEVLKTDQMLPDGSILLHDFKLEAIVSKPN